MRKILVIDDDQFNRAFARDALESAGYSVIDAGDGEEGLEKADAEAPDLVLLDIVMPGMDGIEVCKELKKRDACRITPVIMYTSLNEEKLIETALQAGASDYVIKPPNVAQLRSRVALNLRLAEALTEIERLRRELENGGGLIDLTESV